MNGLASLVNLLSYGHREKNNLGVFLLGSSLIYEPPVPETTSF